MCEWKLVKISNYPLSYVCSTVVLSVLWSRARDVMWNSHSRHWTALQKTQQWRGNLFPVKRKHFFFSFSFDEFLLAKFHWPEIYPQRDSKIECCFCVEIELLELRRCNCLWELCVRLGLSLSFALARLHDCCRQLKERRIAISGIEIWYDGLDKNGHTQQFLGFFLSFYYGPKSGRDIKVEKSNFISRILPVTSVYASTLIFFSMWVLLSLPPV